MIQPNAFADILDAAEKLDPDAQADLVAILSRRLAERGRARVAETVARSRQEFATGQCRTMTAEEMVREATTWTGPCSVRRRLLVISAPG